MNKKKASILSATEGVLPLLDVSLLLLGFFIILLASGAFSSSKSSDTGIDIGNIEKILLLEINDNGHLIISDSENSREITINSLSNYLKQIAGSHEEHSIVIIHLAHPWLDKVSVSYQAAKREIRNVNMRYARVFP